MDSFFIMDNNDGTYRIECKLIVYRNLHGKHPDFLKPEGNAKLGFNTKYFLLIEDNIADKSNAISKANKLNADYNKIITECENSGDWTKFPFKNSPIIYYK